MQALRGAYTQARARTPAGPWVFSSSHRRAALLHRRSARIATRCNDRRMNCSATARAQACEALARAEAPEAAGSLSRLLKLLCTDDEPRVRVRDGPRQRCAARSPR
jgi:hypothetical protein